MELNPQSSLGKDSSRESKMKCYKETNALSGSVYSQGRQDQIKDQQSERRKHGTSIHLDKAWFWRGGNALVSNDAEHILCPRKPVTLGNDD